jgi:hypothetical protein
MHRLLEYMCGGWRFVASKLVFDIRSFVAAERRIAMSYGWLALHTLTGLTNVTSTFVSAWTNRGPEDGLRGGSAYRNRTSNFAVPSFTLSK